MVHSSTAAQCFGKIATILPDKLFFASFEDAPTSNAEMRYILIDDRVHYEPFYCDFGPLNLSVVYRFCNYIHQMIEAKSKRKICFYTDSSDETRDENRVNGAFLLASYCMIYHNVSADQAYLRIHTAEVEDDKDTHFIGFRDASMSEPSYLLHIHDVLRGVEKAIEHGWLNFTNFDPDEYEYYERVENGDFNWIIPGKIISFCGPHEKSVVENGYPYHAPEVYFNYFNDHNVSTIVRLNVKLYDASRFTNAGFQHVDLYFIDGSTPSDDIVERFVRVVDGAPGAVAVHCKAGLGRTGTLIACWMMKEFGLTAAECMAWLRICRPGSVIGPQQAFLVQKQKFCWNMSNNNLVLQLAPRSGKRRDSEKLKKLMTQVDEIRIDQTSNGNEDTPARTPRSRRGALPSTSRIEDEVTVDEHGRSQGDRLLEMKARSQHAAHKEELPASNASSPVVGTHISSTSPNTTSYTGLRSSARFSNNSSTRSPHSPLSRLHHIARYSSPTTPIKPISPALPISSPMTTRARSNFASRNLLSTLPTSAATLKTASVPISKVTVSSSSRTLVGSSRSTSALKRTAPAAGLTSRPYPSTNGLRLELTTSPMTYDLRKRNLASPSVSISGSALSAAASLPPNTEALLGRTRNFRKKYATYGVAALNKTRPHH